MHEIYNEKATINDAMVYGTAQRMVEQLSSLCGPGWLGGPTVLSRQEYHSQTCSVPDGIE
jgi:hypothetical protein